MSDDTLKRIADYEREHSVYYLKRNKRWVQVTEDEFIAAEQRAGFFPKPGCGPVATAGFSYGDSGEEIEGRIDYG